MSWWSGICGRRERVLENETRISRSRNRNVVGRRWIVKIRVRLRSRRFHNVYWTIHRDESQVFCLFNRIRVAGCGVSYNCHHLSQLETSVSWRDVDVCSARKFILWIELFNCIFTASTRLNTTRQHSAHTASHRHTKWDFSLSSFIVALRKDEIGVGTKQNNTPHSRC